LVTSLAPCSVMPGLVPGIHVLCIDETWMAGTSPAMTENLISISPPYFIPSTTAIARVIASSFAAAFPGTDCLFSPGSSKSCVAP
jgi:hypothetical protein